MRVVGILATVTGLAAVVGGCESSPSKPTTRPSSWTTQAQQDPFNYNPRVDDFPDVSGGGLMDFDRNAFKRDVGNVFNP